ncbi:hypothetical protein CYY_010157 [Polysphondylium violaceum]|uniref:Uncharacterized protein n=1 Tax=Polysphondylium violaceum TaxID=133409 RepID=A0A8J4UU68_9MYCE|nr:hypothetical protein CYY_010157 [Polysphondylium violaceum]
MPPSVTAFKSNFPTFPVYPFSTSNLVSIRMAHENKFLRISFNIHPGTFPETLKFLDLDSYIGEIHPNSLPASLTDLRLSYATNFSVTVLSLPNTITKLYIKQSPKSKNSKLNVLLPSSLTDLQLMDSPQLVECNPLPAGLKKLQLSNSDLSPTNIVPLGVTDLSYSFNDYKALYPHHLPTSLIHLHLHSHLQTISLPHLRTLDHLKELQMGSSLDLTYLPPNLTKLSVEIPLSDTTNIQLPNTITDLTLWMTELTLFGDIHPDFISVSDSKLPLLQTLTIVGNESNSLTIDNLDFLPNSVTSIINLPMITSNTFTLPPLLNTLEISSSNYKHNFTDKGISLPSHVKFLNVHA